MKNPFYEIDKNKYIIDIQIRDSWEDETFIFKTKADCRVNKIIEDMHVTYYLKAYPFLTDTYPRNITQEDWENVEKSATPVIAKIRLLLRDRLEEGMVLRERVMFRLCHDDTEEEIDRNILWYLKAVTRYQYFEKLNVPAKPLLSIPNDINYKLKDNEN